MFATSMRQPSIANGGRSHCATTESGPSMNRRRSSGLFQSNFGNVGASSQVSYTVFSSSAK